MRTQKKNTLPSFATTTKLRRTAMDTLPVLLAGKQSRNLGPLNFFLTSGCGGASPDMGARTPHRGRIGIKNDTI